MKIKRTELQAQLATVSAGLSSADMIEQSSSFAFRDGRVMTFNDEIACSCETVIKDEVAIPSKEFAALLAKMPDEDLDITIKKKEIRVVGKRREASIPVEKKVTLPFEDVEQAGKWKELPKGFTQALHQVLPCAGTNESVFALTCLVLTSKHIRATDRVQAGQYLMALPVKGTRMIRYSVIPHIIKFDPTHISCTDVFTHFKNVNGTVLSCRNHVEDYPDLSELFDKREGDKIKLPSELVEACSRATLFSSTSIVSNDVQVHLKPKEIEVYGEGACGWFREKQKSKYAGDELSFNMAPEILVKIVKDHNDCLISDSKLTASSGNFQYCTVLQKENNG